MNYFLDIKSKRFIMYKTINILKIYVTEIEISGNQSTYQLGSSYRITCSSDLTVQSIQWLNTSDNGEILTSNTGEQQLVLELDDITAAINNTTCTCEVTLALQTTPVVETIHLLVVNGKKYNKFS